MKTVLTLSLVLSTSLIASANLIEQWNFAGEGNFSSITTYNYDQDAETPKHLAILVEQVLLVLVMKVGITEQQMEQQIQQLVEQ